MFIGKAHINITAGQHTKDDWFSCLCHCFHQPTLTEWKLKILFVTGCIAVPCIPFFSFQSLIQAKTKDYYITVFRYGYSLCNAIHVTGKSLCFIPEKGIKRGGLMCY